MIKISSVCSVEKDNVLLRVWVTPAIKQHIIGKVKEVENGIIFENEDGSEECRFEPDQLDQEPYGKNRFWITKTKPVRLGWTGNFPQDNRFTLTVKGLQEKTAHKILKKLLRHFCRNPDEPSPIMDENDKYECSILVNRLRNTDERKPNSFRHALLKKYANDPYLSVSSISSLLLPLGRASDVRDEEESGKSKSIVCHSCVEFFSSHNV